MCAILDNDVCAEVFGSKPNPAGEGFLDWLDKEHGRLVSGGQNKRELDGNTKFQSWWQQATLAGRVVEVDNKKVTQLQSQLESSGACQSNDAHIIALAQISGARLLYSNDKLLHKDFRNFQLISERRGKIYSTSKNTRFTRHRRALLRKSHCP